MVLCINCDENFRILTFGIIFDQWPKKKCSNKVKWACFILFCMHFYSKSICIFFYIGCYFDPLPARKRLEWEYVSTYHDILYQFYLGFWLFSRGVGEILRFDDSKRVKNQTFLFMDGFGWFINSISLRGCRCEISGQRTPARPAVKFRTLKHLFWVERGSGRAGRVTLGDAKRPAQHQPRRGRTTERMNSAGGAPRSKRHQAWRQPSGAITERGTRHYTKTWY